MKFLCDDNLGKLAKLLRILGYDVLFDSKVDDHKLIRQSLEEERVILTRDTKLVRFKTIRNQILIAHDDPIEQLKQVIRQLGLESRKENLFSRCLLCNSLLDKMEKKDAEERVPAYVFRTHEHFLICRSCNKIFWKGTHVEATKERLRTKGVIFK